MDFIIARIKRYYPIIILLVVELLLFLANYQAGTYFLGWDNLFPEANFPINFQRSIFAIWQEYRGLGLLDGMSYAANLPHYIFLSILSFFVPQSLLRYIFIFLMHLLGGIGVYFLILELLPKHAFNKLASLSGSLFYLLNITTVQMLFTPYELFTVHFAFLPFLLLFASKYIESGSKKNLLWFSIFSALALPQSHVPTIFLVYLFALTTVLLFKLLDKGRQKLSRILMIVFLTFLINAFWGLPYFYSATHNAQIIAESKINQISTEDIYLKNKQFGTLKDVILLEGFSLNFVDNQPDGTIQYMMASWRKHLNNPAVNMVGYSFFLITLIGLFKAIKTRNKTIYPYITLFVLSFLMLGNDIPILSIFSQILNTFIPYFYQLFRFTFTKFSILFALNYSILFSIGLIAFIDYLKGMKFLKYYLLGIVGLSLIYHAIPAFDGYFLYPNLRNKIPQEYFQLVDYFKKQDQNTRIATLPQPTYWGWTYTNWGYKGSGFLWYGLPQATLDGAFYPWSRENENYYWDISQAIYSSDSKLLESIFDKYQIHWLIVDKNTLNPFSQRGLYFEKTARLLRESNKFILTATFGNLEIYKANLDTTPKDFVFLADNLPMIGPNYKWNNLDKAFADYGNYVSDSSTIGGGLEPATPEVSLPHIYYPFRSLFTGRQQNELEFKVEDKIDYFSLNAKIPKELAGYKLIIPELEKKEVVEIDENDLSKKTMRYPQIYLDSELLDTSSFWGSAVTPESTDSGQARMTEHVIDLPYIRDGNLEVRVPKINGFYSSSMNPILMNLNPKSCDQFNKGIYKHEFTTDPTIGEDLLRLTSVGSSNCIDFDLPLLSQDIGYLVTAGNRNTEGKSLLFSVINKNSQRADIETYLPKNPKLNKAYFVIPPMEQYGLGYTLHLDNISIGRVKTVNNLGKITVNPIPYRFLTSLKIVKDTTLQGSTLNGDIKVDHPNPSLYQVEISNRAIEQSSNQVLILSQSFDSGWKAYEVGSTNKESGIKNLINKIFPFWTGREIKNHVLVNNWENGWRLTDNNENIIIIYLPQYLEYIGFILFGAAFLIVIFYPNSPILNPRDGKS